MALVLPYRTQYCQLYYLIYLSRTSSLISTCLNTYIQNSHQLSLNKLAGFEVIDIACGGAHSAAITASGHLYTWGKGRYGRLGHGDSEDQLKPKLVEALVGYKVVGVACGSGDAQTLCITDDDNVWSWGDGDYGKLGRGGLVFCLLCSQLFFLTVFCIFF